MTPTTSRFGALLLLIAAILPGALAAQDVITMTSPNHPTTTGYSFGALAGGGDFTGDGTPDFLVAQYVPGPESYSIPTLADLFLYSGVTNEPVAELMLDWVGLPQKYVAPCLDLNGDAVADFFVLDANEASLSVFSGIPPNPNLYSAILPSVNWVYSIPDATADGVPDFLIGNSIHSGEDGSLVRTLPLPSSYRYVCAFDADGNGVPELLMGNSQSGLGRTDRSKVFDATTGNLVREFTVPNTFTPANFGTSAITLPDTTGDGIAELAFLDTRGSSPHPDLSSDNDVGLILIFNGGTGQHIAELYSYDGLPLREFCRLGPDQDGDGNLDIYIAKSTPVDTSTPSFQRVNYPEICVYSSQTYELLKLFRPLSVMYGHEMINSLMVLDDSNLDGVSDFLVSSVVSWIGIPATNVNTGQVYRFVAKEGIAVLDTPAMDFGRRKVDRDHSVPQSALLSLKESPVSMKVTSLTITGPDAAAFHLLATPTPFFARPGVVTELPISFIPQRAGSHTATLEITTDSPRSPSFSVPLSGVGDPAFVGNSIVWARASSGAARGLYRFNAKTESTSLVQLTGLWDRCREVVLKDETTLVLAERNTPGIWRPSRGRIVEVDLATNTVRDVTSSGAGPVLEGLGGLAIGPDGFYYCTSAGSNLATPTSIFRVDPQTGNRVIVTGPSDGSGPYLDRTGALLFEESGDLLAATRAGLIRVNVATGERVVVGATALYNTISGMCHAAPGVIAVTRPATRSVDLVSMSDGTSTLLSGPSLGSGPEFMSPAGIALDSDGNYLVIDILRRGVFRVYADTGDRELLSSALGVNAEQYYPASYYSGTPNVDPTFPYDEEYSLSSTLMAVQVQAPPPSAASGAWTEYE